MIKIKLENFGKITNADIDLNGITLIAGVNNTGKSTVGKALFCVVQSMNDFTEYYERTKKRKIQRAFYELSSLFRRNFLYKNSELPLALKKNKEMYLFPHRFYHEEISFEKIKKRTEEIEKHIKNKQGLKSIKNYIDIIKNLLEKEVNDEEKFYFSLYNKFRDVFKGSINNSLYKDETKVEFSVDDNKLKFSVINNDIDIKKISLPKRNLSINDITFIDNPLIIRFLDSEDPACIYSDDLIEKIKKSKTKHKDISLPSQDIIKYIKRDIFGKSDFIFDSNDEVFSYKVDKNADSLDVVNMASGSKLFAIIYSLLKTNILNPNHILVLDEPENHLHPEWQVKFAELLVILQKNTGTTILATSHSPYFIKAIEYYSRKYGILEKSTDFYLAEGTKKSNYANIKNQNKDIENIFELLSKPLDKLVYNQVEK